MKDVKDYILDIENFPKEGVVFRDITSLLKDPEGLRMTIDKMDDILKDTDFDVIAGAESRGFIFGMPIAYNLNKPFIPIRKKEKLPRETVSKSYDLEYGQATIEIHKDAIKPGTKVVIADDLIATGGTMKAAVDLMEELGGEVVKIVCVIELTSSGGRELLKDYDLETVVKYD